MESVQFPRNLCGKLFFTPLAFPCARHGEARPQQGQGAQGSQEAESHYRGELGMNPCRCHSFTKRLYLQDDDPNMLMRLEDVGNSSDEFVQVQWFLCTETVQILLIFPSFLGGKRLISRPAKGKEAIFHYPERHDQHSQGKGNRNGIFTVSVLNLTHLSQSKHRCHTSCTCVELDRGTLRQRLSTTEENHMRENLRCKDSFSLFPHEFRIKPVNIKFRSGFSPNPQGIHRR